MVSLMSLGTSIYKLGLAIFLLLFTCSKSTIETLEKGVKYVKS